MSITIVENIADPLTRITRGIHEFLAFFAEYPEFVELLIQERAQFKDRTRPTFIEHRLVNVERWQDMYRALIADGRVRELPVDGITDVVGNLLYGTIFMNYFSGQSKSVEAQAHDIVDVALQRNSDGRRAIAAGRSDPQRDGIGANA